MRLLAATFLAVATSVAQPAIDHDRLLAAIAQVEGHATTDLGGRYGFTRIAWEESTRLPWHLSRVPEFSFAVASTRPPKTNCSTLSTRLVASTCICRRGTTTSDPRTKPMSKILSGEVIRMGTMTVGGEELDGVFVRVSKDELRALEKAPLRDIYGALWVEVFYDPESEAIRKFCAPLLPKLEAANAVLKFHA